MRNQFKHVEPFNYGFTLIELMIVVAIVGILASIAYPSYVNYIRKAQRTDGHAALMDTAQRLERCYTAQNTYVSCNASAEHLSEQKYWKVKVDVSVPGGQGYKVTATKTDEGVDDSECGDKMAMDQTGSRLPVGCW